MNLNNVFLNLSCSFDSSGFHQQSHVSPNEERTIQYADGFKKFFKIYKKYSNSYDNIYIVDNTLQNLTFLDQKIKMEIPESVNFIFSKKNDYGRLNKGAGLLENWNYVKDIFKKYKYIFHYEPRLIMDSPIFIESFLKNKGNTFLKHPSLDTQFQTGAFLIELEDMIDYLNYRSAKSLSDNSICIEDDLCFFFKKFKKNNFTLESDSGMFRHDAKTGYHKY